MAMAVLRAGWEQGAQFGPALAALARRPGRCWLAAALLFVVGVPAQQGEFFLPSWGVAAHLAIGLAAALLVLPAALPAAPARSPGCSRPRWRGRSYSARRAGTWSSDPSSGGGAGGASGADQASGVHGSTRSTARASAHPPPRLESSR